MASERTSIGFGGGEVAIVKLSLRAARNKLAWCLRHNLLWSVEADYRMPVELCIPVECAKARKPGVYEQLVINPQQVKVLQRVE